MESSTPLPKTTFKRSHESFTPLKSFAFLKKLKISVSTSAKVVEDRWKIKWIPGFTDLLPYTPTITQYLALELESTDVNPNPQPLKNYPANGSPFPICTKSNFFPRNRRLLFWISCFKFLNLKNTKISGFHLLNFIPCLTNYLIINFLI